MKVFLGADHAGFDGKDQLMKFLRDQGHDLIDVGTFANQSCHYPDFAIGVVKGLHSDPQAKGILICGSGIGMSMAANRFSGIRAGLCRSVIEAELTRAHNDANILCLGQRLNTLDELKAIAQTFLKTPFEGGRHQGRIDLFNDLGEKIK